ncbi:cytochrome c maturation protein CcmE [Asaia sp. W19]|uniref:cytochrome c maturation protein CcmE n=1 Tax=unclassified Asaia TaxID=2685023 RepID=UPI000F8D879A|nr:cytochrome c maturation protein CcmE [Asaia sp. W19]RUT25448.1 cytochrome c maturation protein CcmE [Asaia sp. W19]
MTRKTRRLWLVMSCLACFAVATALVLNAFSSSIVFFMAPSQILKSPPPGDRMVRLGGMVVAGSLRRTLDGQRPVNLFQVTDGQAALEVRFEGILPDLFREGQSVVALGTYAPGKDFAASEVLAKHDETYMPKEVAEALQRSGKWDPRFGKPPSSESLNSMTRSEAVNPQPIPGAASARAPARASTRASTTP